MTVTIKPKRGSGTPLSTNLAVDELAVDSTNRRLFTRQGLSVVELGNNPRDLNVDDINIDNNTISVTTSNTDLNLTPNGTGVVKVNGDLSFDGGFGSVAPVFGVRAWLNINTKTFVVRGSGNINTSTITDDGTGGFSVQFINPMPDANYCVVGSAKTTGTGYSNTDNVTVAPWGLTTTGFSVQTSDASQNTYYDCDNVFIMVIR